MSVLACDRTGCENVMCDRWFPALQLYVCRDCLAELRSAMHAAPAEEVDLGGRQFVRRFMAGPKGERTHAARVDRLIDSLLAPLGG